MENTKLITEIELLDGTTVPINTRISIKDVLQAQNEKLLDKNFLNNMLKRQAMSAIHSNDYINAVFVCYRAAGGNMSVNEFRAVCPFDMEILGVIFGQMMTGGKEVKKTHFQSSLESATKK